MKKKQEETYRLTFKGFVWTEMTSDERTSEFMDALELWLRRIDCNAVILTKSGEFEAHKVYLDEVN